MTYWLAWKSGNSAFIVADAALTVSGIAPRRPMRPSSAFGEPHVYDPVKGYSVFEGVLKIAELGRVLYVFAGTESVGLSFGRCLQDFLSQGVDPYDSFLRTMKLYAYAGRSEPVHCAIAYYDEKQPRLVSGQTDTAIVQEVDSVIGGGCMPDHYAHQLSRVPAILDPGRIDVSETLMVIVALLQSFGVHDFLLRGGIGGFYQGISIGPTGITRVPSCAYCLYDGNENLKTRDLLAIYHQPHIVIIRKAKDPRYGFIEVLHWESIGKPARVTLSDKEEIKMLQTDFVCFVRRDCRTVVLFQNKDLHGAPLLKISSQNQKPTFTIDTSLRFTFLEQRIDNPMGEAQALLIRPSRSAPNKYDLHTLKLPLWKRRRTFLRKWFSISG